MNPTTTSNDLTSLSSGLLGSSIVIYAGVFVAIAIIFIWRAKSSVQSAFGFVLLFALSLALPASLLVLNQQTNVGSKATASVKTLNVSVSKLSGTQFAITFQTSQPVVAYVEFKDATSEDFIPVLPQYSLTDKSSHSILVTSKTTRGGQAYLVISGDKYLPNGTLLELR